MGRTDSRRSDEKSIERRAGKDWCSVKRCSRSRKSKSRRERRRKYWKTIGREEFIICFFYKL